MKRTMSALFLGLAVSLAATAPAAAQIGPGHDSARSGVWGGLGFGWGSVSCSDCDDSTSGFTSMGIIGGTLSDVVRIGGGGIGFFRSENDADFELSSGLFIVQVFPGGGDFYLQGGAGFGAATLSFDDIVGTDVEFTDEGAAFSAGVGYSWNLGARKKWAIVPFANWMGTTIDFEPYIFQVGVGFFWN